ncbi:N-acetylmuramoyl-L-alanine amidase [Salinisphaera hydrothermalis]|uniref:N-acetylmuramoyl-L-alanine amidase n=1 Tax=Salinisphaera hydrothermalis (strain C41B8) TaxID=1304275 RepID=A0A084IHU4_SALHC|nr:N-acetylmuramoyl-L-alanine amidase [Salinisphaera hydrothermalis]KEZ76278.1 N-acetylmuramoyl-L-alanine amidase [Salinisphaera hydrothermalis C41B8]
MPRWLGYGLLLGIVLVSPACWAAGATLESVHLSTHGSTTTVRFDFQHLPKYRYFALGHPPRAVIDFDGARADGVPSPAGGGVGNIRLARHADGTLRAVLDLSAGAELSGVHADGHDLVATIEGGTSGTNTASHGAQETGDSPLPAKREKRSAPPATAARDDDPKALYRAAAETGPVVVVIDPGHGGHDSGTRAASGLMEKTVVLGIAKALYAKLKATPNIHPVLTRDSDTFVTLPGRVKIAQKHHANLFISIHQNAYPNDHSVDGGTCYVLSQHGASDAKAAQLAHFENSADRNVAGVHFSDTDHTLNAVLTDLYQNASIDDADDLAHDIIGQFAKVEPIYRHTPPRANFAVLRDPMIPSVLCETAFLSNPKQARKLATSHFRDQLAGAIYQGIMTYFRKHPPERMQPVGGSIYTVKSGDTLSEIASRENVSENVLMDINHLHTKTLKVGQKLELPGGS